MKLEGSCHCGAVQFSLDAPSPAPFLRCYCSVCRKVSGGGGYAINLGGLYDTMKIEGADNIRQYRKIDADPDTGEDVEADSARAFCGNCGTALWNYDPRWPDLVHPFASAIDSGLPTPPQSTHMMLGSKANWVSVEGGANDLRFDDYPDESLADWHQRHGFGDDR